MILIGIVAALGYRYRDHLSDLTTLHASRESASHADPAHAAEATGPEPILYPEDQWKAAGIGIGTVSRSPLKESIALTGKITLNEDRLAHIFPLVEGRVDAVHVRLGDRVRKGQTLVVLQSKEVGQRMLELFHDRMKLEFARARDAWTQEVGQNTLSLVEQMKADASVDQIEQAQKNRRLGDAREKLMTAYVTHRIAETNLQRLQPLTSTGAIPVRQIAEAESARDSARATLQAILEQTTQDVALSSRQSAQTVRELQTGIAIAETTLKILGFEDEDLQNIDPSTRGEELAHVSIVAPFDGTVISKDVVLLERAGPEQQILTIADLSSVWVSADIYEAHLPLLAQLEDQVLTIRSEALPARTFTARIFYTGDVVQEGSRTIALRAVAENPDGLLKPGLFVTVELPSLDTSEALHVPRTAIQDHQGQSFVFIQTSPGAFQRRDVVVGRKNPEDIEILSGLEAGDRIAVSGGFALKSRMLAELLAE